MIDLLKYTLFSLFYVFVYIPYLWWISYLFVLIFNMTLITDYDKSTWRNIFKYWIMSICIAPFIGAFILPFVFIIEERD